MGHMVGVVAKQGGMMDVLAYEMNSSLFLETRIRVIVVSSSYHVVGFAGSWLGNGITLYGMYVGFVAYTGTVR